MSSAEDFIARLRALAADTEEERALYLLLIEHQNWFERVRHRASRDCLKLNLHLLEQSISLVRRLDIPRCLASVSDRVI